MSYGYTEFTLTTWKHDILFQIVLFYNYWDFCFHLRTNICIWLCRCVYLHSASSSLDPTFGKYSIIWAGFGWFLGLKCFWDLAIFKLIERTRTWPRRSSRDALPKTFWDFKTFKMSSNQQLSHHGDDENGKCFVVVLYLLSMKN